jgi:hypothetical protein
MTIAIIQLFPPTVLTTSAATLFTMPTSPTTSILRNGRMRFLNTTASPVTVTAYAVPKGGTAGVGNAFLDAQSIAANAYLDTDIPVMAEGDFLQALASAGTAVTASELDGVIFS